jgi:hypothetical protein
MLLLYCVAQKTGRKALWHWVANHNCNAPFHSLFETDAIEVSEDTFGLDGVTIGEGWGCCSAAEVNQRAEQETDCQALLLRDGYFGHNFEGLDEIIRPCREVDRRVTQFMEWNWSDKTCAIVDAVASLYLLRNTQGIIGSSVSGYSICAGWDCGLINLPPDRCYNFSWSGDALAFKPPRLFNVPRVPPEQDSQSTHHEQSTLNHPASAV